MGTLCGMPYEEGEYCQLWHEKRVRARKPHRCYECGGDIPVGMVHGRATGLYDGSWGTWRRCAACLILAERVATQFGECALWGGLDEYISYRNDDLPEEEEIPSPKEHRAIWEAA